MNICERQNGIRTRKSHAVLGFIETRASAERGDLGEKLSRPGGAYFNGSSILNWGLHESYHVCKRGRHWLGSGLYYGRPWIACSSPLPSDCLSSLCLIKTNEAKWQASERDCRSKCHLKKGSFFFIWKIIFLTLPAIQPSLLQSEVHLENPFAKYLRRGCHVWIVRDQGLFSCPSPTSIFPKLLPAA